MFVFSGCFFSSQNQTVCYAEEEMTYEEIEQKLEETINKQFANLDFSRFEEILSGFDENQSAVFGSGSFFEKLHKLTQGEFVDSQSNLWSVLINLFFDDVLEFLPLLSSIVSIAIAYSLVSTAKPKLKKNSIGDIIHFVCYGAIIVLSMSSILSIIKTTATTIASIKSQMDISFPLLLTMLKAVGSVSTTSVFQPSIALLSGTIMTIFSNILMPLFIFRLVFSILSNISSNVKFNKFADLFSTIFKWIIGFVFTVFLGFMTIQGITAGSFDGVSIRAAKFAVKSSVPVIGGYLSDGMNLILSSSILIKNAIGVGGILLLFATVIVPIIKIIVFMLVLKFSSAILEPLTDSRISSFLSMLSKSISLLVIILVGVSFMYVIMTGLVVSTGNYF